MSHSSTMSFYFFYLPTTKVVKGKEPNKLLAVLI